MKTLGILGGMGPLAGAYFYRRVVECTAAEGDSCHIPTILWGDPAIPDRTAHLLRGGPSPRPALKRGVSMLRRMGAEVIAVPCNTAHAYLDRLDKGVELPNMPVLAVRRAASGGACRVGLLSTRGTLSAGLYAHAAASFGLSLVTLCPESAEGLERCIYRQKAGARVGREEYLPYAELLLGAGADTVILGCTEISVAFSGVYPAGFVDALDELAREAVVRCGALLREEVSPRDVWRAAVG